jgi:hypothetical protein
MIRGFMMVGVGMMEEVAGCAAVLYSKLGEIWARMGGDPSR